MPNNGKEKKSDLSDSKEEHKELSDDESNDGRSLQDTPHL